MKCDLVRFTSSAQGGCQQFWRRRRRLLWLRILLGILTATKISDFLPTSGFSLSLSLSLSLSHLSLSLSLSLLSLSLSFFSSSSQVLLLTAHEFMRCFNQGPSPKSRVFGHVSMHPSEVPYFCFPSCFAVSTASLPSNERLGKTAVRCRLDLFLPIFLKGGGGGGGVGRI